MAETATTATIHEMPIGLSHLFGAKMIDNAETAVHAQVEFLSDIEETMMATLRTQQQALQKVLDLIGEARGGNSFADQIKFQLAMSEHCLTTGLALWRDTAARMSEQTLKRIEAGRKAATDMASAGEESRKAGWNVVEKTAQHAKSSARRAQSAAEAAE